jgi:hypothetical protein
VSGTKLDPVAVTLACALPNRTAVPSMGPGSEPKSTIAAPLASVSGMRLVAK